MNKWLKLIIASSIISGCSNDRLTTREKDNYLKFIDSQTELILSQTDDRFGEWGGNTFEIRVYFDYYHQKLKADYKEYQGQKGPPAPPKIDITKDSSYIMTKPLVYEKSKIKLATIDSKLIEDANLDRCRRRIYNDELMANAGITNEINFSGSLLIVYEYPSFKRNKFHEVISELIKK